MTLTSLQQQIIETEKLHIVGNKSQHHSDHTDLLSLSSYSGIIEYHPEELVITVKAGTTMSEIKHTLTEKGQALTFASLDNSNATIGGMYALGNADLRDAILGVKLINGQGKILNFGGQVMKNVAGYDVARLLVGSQGILAAICEISFKVLPSKYIHIQPAVNTVINSSPFVSHIERGLKTIFDPDNRFN